MVKRKVLITGAGIGGLSTALRLAKRGYQVEIIEKNHQAGGRLNQLARDGFVFDTGPSFFSMSYVFKELADDCGIALPFQYNELNPLYAVNIRNNPKTYFLFKDIQKLAEQFSDKEPDFENKMRNYLKNCGLVFNETFDVVIRSNFDSVIQYFLSLMRVNPMLLPLLLRSFWKEVTRHFSSHEARQIISLVAFFLGRTPFDTMAVYTLLSHVEFCYDGYYNVSGGMYKIVEGLLNELIKENVVIHYNTEIIDYIEHNGKLKYLTDRSGKKWDADIFVVNADAAVFRGAVFRRPAFSEERMKRMHWTTGYLTFYVGVKCKLPQVHHHNYFLGANYREYAEKILTNPDLPEKPYYYVNVVSKYNQNCAPEGCESLFFVCPVPNLLYKKNWNDKENVVFSILDDFSQHINLNIRPFIASLTIYTPEDWQDMYNIYKGSCLGLSHNMWQIGAFRPKNFDEKFENVFYVGASTTPGTGIPMVIIGSKLVTDRIEKYSEP